MIRINIHSSAPNKGLVMVEKKETFTKKITACRSGGGVRAVGRGAR